MRTLQRISSFWVWAALPLLLTACAGSSHGRPVGYTPPHELAMHEARGSEAPARPEATLERTPSEPLPVLGAVRPPPPPPDALEDGAGEDGADGEIASGDELGPEDEAPSGSGPAMEGSLEELEELEEEEDEDDLARP